ncbi:MAG TPA: transposase [Tangfeifania sp.]|nr:transposase [Tangfeifania sp.]
MKKEAYRHNLPHFQQPGQAYFVTWILKDAVPPKAFPKYTNKLQQLRNQIELHKQKKSEKNFIDGLQKEYYSVRKKYMKAFDDLLALSKNKTVDLSHSENTGIISETIHFWDNIKLKNIAYSIMPNHVHWVLEVFEKDENRNPVYLQDIMQSVKRQSARQINLREGRAGKLWQKENFDTTIRDEKHMYNAIEYTLNNPVNAGLVKNRDNWPGNYLNSEYLF